MRARSCLVVMTTLGILLSACNGADTNSPGLDGRWGAAQLVETDNGTFATDPQIAIEAGTDAIVVWDQWDGGGIRFNRFSDGTGWGTAGVVPESVGGTVPRVASDRNGRAIVVWQNTNGVTSLIRANRYVAGLGWGSTHLVSTDNTAGSYNPEIASDLNGNAIVVWRQDNVIAANAYNAVSGWGTASVISDNAEVANTPQVAFDNNGNAVAVWYQSDGASQSIRSRRYSVGSGWDNQSMALDNTWVDDPRIAMNDRGDAVAAWRKSWTDNVTLSVNVWTRIYAPGTGWGPETMISDNTGFATSPQVAIDPNGNAVAIWRQYNGTTYVMWANRYSRERGWGTAVIIGPQDAGDALPSQVAMDSHGNAIAVWTQVLPGPSHVWVNRHREGIGWGTPSLLDNNDMYRASSPRMAIDDVGNAIAVWQQLPHTGVYDIWARRFQRQSP